MSLRKGKTKTTLEASTNSALLAVEIYNKPRTTFRSEAYISLMIIAWTRLFHAHFSRTIGNKFYYKCKNGRYELVDGERKAWDLSTCIEKYGRLKQSVISNLEFFIKLRNKIEHRHIDKREVDTLIFGECQSLLYNYENLLIELFGSKYAINEALVYSLQFSQLRTKKQKEASRSVLSKDLSEIVAYIGKYRDSLEDDIYNSQEYSIKLIQIPKISNTNRADAAIEFVKWDELNAEDRKAYKKVTAIVKTKIVKQEAVNVHRFKPGKVIEAVNKATSNKINHHDHKCLFVIFSIRPDTSYLGDKSKTNAKYCLYDEVHKDYVYTQEWIDVLIEVLNKGKMERFMWKSTYKYGRKYNLRNYM